MRGSQTPTGGLPLGYTVAGRRAGAAPGPASEMRAAAAILLAASLLAAGPARAGEDGLVVGARTALGFAFGKIDGKTTYTVADAIPGVFPFWLEIGYRFDVHWSLSAFFQYGPASVDACPAGFSCSASVQRLGANAIYRFDPGQFTPWMGFGTGYEWLNLDRGVAVAAGGLELNLQIGGDFRLASGIGLGPYLCFSVGQFTSVTGGGVPQPVERTTHGWVQVGAKVTFDL